MGVTARIARVRSARRGGRRSGERELRADSTEDNEMHGTWMVRMLSAMTQRSSVKATDAELAPIEPGAWAAWVHENRWPAGPAPAGAPRNTRVSPGRFELNAAVHPRGRHLRWR